MFKRILRAYSTLFLICFVQGMTAHAQSFKIVRGEATAQKPQVNGLIVDFVPQHYDVVPVEVNGRTYVRYQSLTSGSTPEEGKPDLPLEGILVGVPPNTQPTVSILESRFETVQSEDIAPVPRKKFTEEGDVVTTYILDEVFYSSYNQFYPSSVVQVGELSELRHQIAAKISVAPFQYNPVTKTLKKVAHLRFRIEFRPETDKPENTWTSIREEDLYFEPVYKELLLNYDDAKEWKGTYGPIQPPTIIDSTGGWFVPGRQYYRIPAARDGFYSLTAAQMRQAGIEPSLIDFSTVALYNRGRSIPILIGNQGNPDSVYIDYYARRNYGYNTYDDLYSDTSSYFLTWNDTSARRFRIDSALSAPPQFQPVSYREKIHLEQDLYYYLGCKQIAITDEEPGEGWYWHSFDPNVSPTTRSYSFNLDTVIYEPGGVGTLKVRLNGMTCLLSGTSEHRARFTLNGNVLGDTTFIQDSAAVFFQSFPDTMLRSGSNTLRVTTVPTGSSVNKFYLDWFEVEFSRPFYTANNQLLFTYPASSGVVEFRASGFTTITVDVFDLTLGRKILTRTLIDQQQMINAVFRDTLSVSKQYLVVGRDTRLQPIGLQPKIFGNLRSRNNGADYLVLTHSKFRSAADRIAQHRRTASRLRTTVVDVQDIFDEFNFGHKNPPAIRDFLRHTYYNWRRPSPTYVLILGDACWDYKGILASTIKKDYVPAYGNPPSDNALVSFHPVKNYLPYMLIGRISVEDSVQAHRVVSKVIQYDNPPVDEWNKSFLFVTGGTTPSERIQFNSNSNLYINNYVLPSPIGGVFSRFYKTSDVVIDGEFRDSIRNVIAKGLLYYNFIGHSGGRILNVDPGSPNDFQNTSGKLFFMNATSCWIGQFSAPNSNVYGEDLLFADNRAAIGVWASSFLGNAVTGNVLTTKFLASMKQDYARSFGQLTTISRLYFWVINFNTTPTVIEALHQHPLLGDPYSLLALPTRPDLAFKDSALSLSTDRPTQDSIVTLKAKFWNYGLVPTDSVRLSITDSYTDIFGRYHGVQSVIPPIMLPPTRTVDSVLIPWDIRGQAGTHVLTAILDSMNVIQELTKANNTTQQTFYIYLNTIAALKPPAFSTTASGPTTLTVTVPSGNDTTPIQYYFEIDTLSNFSSGWRVSSPADTLTPVVAEWTTPLLTNNEVYFWRSRTFDGNRYGAWSTSSLQTNDTAVSPGRIRWNQYKKKQFELNRLENAISTDSGVTMTRTNGLPLYVRSVGNRANPDQDFYSIIRVGNQTIFGLWWVVGNRYLVARINHYSGAFEYKAFDAGTVGTFWADSMANYLRRTPVGNYVAITVIYNGSTTNQNLLGQLDTLGALNIRQLQNGHAWAFISRKGVTGPLMTPIESWSPTAVAVCSLQMPTYHNADIGRVYSPFIGSAHQWNQLRWASDTSAAGTNIVLKVMGVQQNLLIDTLYTLPSAQTSLDLSTVSASQYPQLQLLAFLSNTDPQFTPRLLEWSIDYVPPAELATSAWAFHASPNIVNQGTPINIEMDVYNLGYRRADSVSITFSLATSGQQLHSVIVDSIPVNSSRRITTQVPTTNVPTGANVLQTRILPRTGENDLYSGNNMVFFPFTVVGAGQEKVPLVKVLFDGKEIVDGDYVSPSPTIRIEFVQQHDEPNNSVYQARVLIDGKEIQAAANNIAVTDDIVPARTDRTDPPVPLERDRAGVQVIEIRPELTDGPHQLHVVGNPEITGFQKSSNDSLLANVEFNVLSTAKLLNVYNYPNPFPQGTYFTFTVTGAQPPEEIQIKIYSVAGRLLRNITVPSHVLRLGFNRIYWDGRDEDGDEVANGSYFYKVIAKSAGKNVEVVQRLSKIK